MSRRSPVGNPILWIVAAFVIPELVKKCKPLAKTVGDALVNAGESFRKASEQPPAAEAPEASAEPVAETASESKAAEEPASPAKSKKSKAAAEPPVEGAETESA